MMYLWSLQGLLDVFKKQSPKPYCSQTSALPEGVCREFSVAEIKAATNNFHPSSFIAKGLYGPVYRGTIDHGTKAVAIKIHNGKLRPKMFRNEVLFLCQLRHPRLASLIGICYDQNQIFVVYEYMSGEQLGYYLYRKDYPPLVWEQRLKICIGAARGLHYLHTGAKYVVIHRDIRSSHIILDDDWYCKLVAFHFSKMGPPSMSRAVIRKVESDVMGTFGYMAPEYRLKGELTEKCDVFSFGVVLFEVLCARKAHDHMLPQNHQQDLVEWAIKLGSEGSMNDAIDPYLKGKIAPECLNKYLEIACSCIHYEGNQRPDMGEVEVMLELALELQNKADSEMEGINPHGDQWMYEDASVPSSIFEFCYHRNCHPVLETENSSDYIKHKRRKQF